MASQKAESRKYCLLLPAGSQLTGRETADHHAHLPTPDKTVAERQRADLRSRALQAKDPYGIRPCNICEVNLPLAKNSMMTLSS